MTVRRPTRGLSSIARWRPVEPRRFLLLLIPAAGVLLLGGYLIYATVVYLGAMPCRDDDELSGWRIVAGSTVAFAIGHVMNHLRSRNQIVRGTVRANHPALAAASTHLALLLFFSAVAALLVYEAVSLWNPPGDNAANPWGLQPITDYVRCAKSVAPWTTLVVAVAVSLLAGHWLWPRQRIHRAIPPPRNAPPPAQGDG
jgi:hypothetical protein